MIASRLTPLLAHQYGWDELLMFGVPIVLAVAGVRYAEKRAAHKKQLAANSAEDPAQTDTSNETVD